MISNRLISTLAMALTLGVIGNANAQVAGSTILGVSVTEAMQVAMGWSAKKSLLGKTIYSDAGEKIGKVEDLIISPDRNVSYLIIAAGGFIGIGKHDVAVPAVQVLEQNGRLVMTGATRDIVKSMPRFDYADDVTQRTRFIAGAEQDIAKAKRKAAELRTAAAAAGNEAKAMIEARIAALEVDLTSAETKLSKMKQAGAKRWKDFEREVSAATARLRKALDTATG